MTLAHAPARAATITVTDGGDAGTATTCTLRQAIISANLNAHKTSSCVDGSNSDTIVFADALANSTITLGGSQLAITGPLTIVGSGQTIDANHASRAMYVLSTTLSASNISLVNGTAPSGFSGGGLFVASSTAYLANVVVSGNEADNGAGIAALTPSTIQLSNCSVTGNIAADKGGGLQIANNTMAMLAGTVVSGNTAARGGGVFTGYNGRLALSQSTISGNTAASAATPSGGGLYGGGGAAFKCTSISVVDTTVSGNTSNHQGGGIFVDHCPLSVVNSTIAGNTSTNTGGGIYVRNGDATLINATVSANNAVEGGGMRTYAATGNTANTISLANTIVSANTVDPSYPDTADIAVHNSTASAQYSLLGTALSSGALASSVANVFTDDPGLGPLQNNGGPTLTMALLPASLAIDAGSTPLASSDGHALIGDQRGGFYRVMGSSVDIGAFEYQPDRICASGFEALP